MPFAKKRKYLFGITGTITPNSTKLSPLSENTSNSVKKNFIQNLIKYSNERNIKLNNENSELVSQEIDSKKCCLINHISEFTSDEKNLLLNTIKN